MKWAIGELIGLLVEIEVERISSRLLLVPLLPVIYTVHCTRSLYNGAKY